MRWKRCTRPVSAPSSTSSQPTGETDELGPTLSLRGLDARAYYRHDGAGRWSTTPAPATRWPASIPWVREMILDSLRHFVRHAGVDGFRFDLATVLGRQHGVFTPEAALLRDMRADPLLCDRC